MLDISEKNVRKNMVLSTVYRALSMVISYLYVPVVLAYLGEVKYGVWTTILNVLSFIFSISIEMLQLLLRLGTFQLSDIFYNTVGGVLGGLMYCVVMKARKHL